MSESLRSAPGPLVVDVAATELIDADRELLAKPGVGGVILFSANYQDPAQLAALTRQIRETNPNLLVMVDTEGGRVQRFRDGFTTLPAMRQLGQAFVQDPDFASKAAREVGWLMAAELLHVGVDLPLAPVVDIDSAESKVIGDRSFSDDPSAVLTLARAFCGGLREAGSAATAKHYPGHGSVTADSHHELPVDCRTPDALETDQAIYSTLIGDELESLMTAHVRYPAVDHWPASFSSVWVQNSLRSKLGFNGAVFSDDLTMVGAESAGDPCQRAVNALSAGCDFVPLCHDRHSASIAADAIRRADSGASRERRCRLASTLRDRQNGATRLDEDSTRQRAVRVRELIDGLPNCS